MTTSTSTIIHANVFDPTGFRLFKGAANDRAECQTISCSNADCPLLARGQCHKRGGLWGNHCPYGHANRETGPTKRAGSFYKWIRDHKEKYKDVPFLSAPASKMEFIGDYVLLPYAHMDMCKSLPWERGGQFLRREHWTLEAVQQLLDHRPRSMMGSEITSYQTEQVPKFSIHLRESDPTMWQKLIAVRPYLDVAPNHVGRKAILSTLNSPLEWTQRDNDHGYSVNWKWDGETLMTTSMNCFSGTWGRVDVESVVIHAKPKPMATVTVQSNDWVNAKTEFEN